MDPPHATEPIGRDARHPSEIYLAPPGPSFLPATAARISSRGCGIAAHIDLMSRRGQGPLRATTVQMSAGEAASRKMKAFQFLLAARRPVTAIERTEVFGWTGAGDVTRAHRPLPAAVKLPAGEGLPPRTQPLRSRHLIGT